LLVAEETVRQSGDAKSEKLVLFKGISNDSKSALQQAETFMPNRNSWQIEALQLF